MEKPDQRMTETVPLEEDEQITLVEWLELNRFKFTAIPNSTFTKSWKVKNRNKAMGLRAGLPDLMVIVPINLSDERYEPNLVFIEMKREKKSLTKLSKEQEEWIHALNGCYGIDAKVCYGAQEAITYLSDFL